MLESLFDKIVVLRACNFIKKTLTKVFSCEICNYFDKHLNVYFLILFKKRLQHSCEFCELYKNTYFVDDLPTSGSKKSVRGPHFSKVASLTA